MRSTPGSLLPFRYDFTCGMPEPIALGAHSVNSAATSASSVTGARRLSQPSTKLPAYQCGSLSDHFHVAKTSTRNVIEYAIEPTAMPTISMSRMPRTTRRNCTSRWAFASCSRRAARKVYSASS